MGKHGVVIIWYLNDIFPHYFPQLLIPYYDIIIIPIINNNTSIISLMW